MDWKQLINDALCKRPKPLKARTYRHCQWNTASHPVVLGCEDTHDYVVKGRQNGKMIVNEQIVGCLGRLIGAPVGEVRLIEIPKVLIDAQQELSHIQSGIAHGSKFIPNCSDRQWINHEDVDHNKNRFCKLALLYGLVVANDHQLIYELSDPKRVYSVDHGHFFPDGPSWTVESLREVTTAEPDLNLVNECNLSKQELYACAQELENMVPEGVAMVVAAPHESWSISMEERIAVAEYIEKRRTELLAYLKN